MDHVSAYHTPMPLPAKSPFLPALYRPLLCAVCVHVANGLQPSMGCAGRVAMRIAVGMGALPLG